jgi:hypothetical protein
MVETPLPQAARCAWCLVEHELAQSPFEEQRVPQENDASFCVRCGRFSIFRADLTMRLPTDEEVAEILHDEDAQRLLMAWINAGLTNPRGRR